MGNTTLRRVCLSLMAVDRAVNSTLANWKESQSALNELRDALAVGSKEHPDILPRGRAVEIIATARMMRNAKRDERHDEQRECARTLERHREWIRATYLVEDDIGGALEESATGDAELIETTRYVPPKCKCGGENEVKHTAPKVRHLKCRKCGKTSKHSRTAGTAG